MTKNPTASASPVQVCAHRQPQGLEKAPIDLRMTARSNSQNLATDHDATHRHPVDRQGRPETGLTCVPGVYKGNRRSIVGFHPFSGENAEHVVDFECEVSIAVPEQPSERAHRKPGVSPDPDPTHAHATAELESHCRRRKSDERGGTAAQRERARLPPQPVPHVPFPVRTILPARGEVNRQFRSHYVHVALARRSSASGGRPCAACSDQSARLARSERRDPLPHLPVTGSLPSSSRRVTSVCLDAKARDST
ncbi:uncharacterized protein SOCEGT47_051310 [Sorangium cellulosum]|uniref:Uncharacterized protein n=1 Tax=Sorangium cellulosum TaxID=56 RepID=A0A4V0NE15_SORCE|nr:uncharacterized protein SOCEGT47_051310 [Sorangium cellulosum]